MQALKQRHLFSNRKKYVRHGGSSSLATECNDRGDVMIYVTGAPGFFF